MVESRQNHQTMTFLSDVLVNLQEKTQYGYNWLLRVVKYQHYKEYANLYASEHGSNGESHENTVTKHEGKMDTKLG